MLKIKDNVDLKELEKYGFEYESILKVYYKVIISKRDLFFLFRTLPNARVVIINEEKEIITKKMRYWLDWNVCQTNEKDIKDLIKDGLVEKVE